MALTTGMAILGAAGIAASAFGASRAASAAKKAGQLQYDASQAAIASQERIFNQTRADNEYRRQVGDSALGALAGSFGLSGPSMTGAAPSYASTPVPNAGGISMTGGGLATAPGYAPPAGGYRIPTADERRAAGGVDGGGGPVTMTDKTPGGFAGTSPLPASPGGPDWNRYLAENPDVAAWAQSGHGDPNIPIEQQSMEQRAAFHYQNSGQAAGYQLPTVQAPAPGPTMTGGAPGPAPGYADPTAPGGYTPAARPDAGPAPGPYVAGPRPTVGAAPTLDLSLDSFRASPDYKFQVQEMERALGNASSSMGGVMSGQRVKAALDRSRSLADGQFTDWRTAETDLYRTDLAQHNLMTGRGDAIYSEDRGFGYGQNRDATGDFERTRARSDGLYADDRARTDTRYDTRNNTLLNMAGFGAQASGQNQSAAQSFAQSQSNLTMAGAQARGNAATGAANAWNQGLGNLMTTGAYLAGSYLGGGGASGGMNSQQWSI